MSNENTPAVERAQAAQREKAWRRRHPDVARSLQYDHGWADAMADVSLSAPDWPARDQAMIRSALAAVLSVEEMACELFVADSGQDRAFALGIWRAAPDDQVVKKHWRRIATDLRSALLGGAS